MIARIAEFGPRYTEEAPRTYWHIIRTAERGVRLFRLHKEGDALEHETKEILATRSLRHKQHSPDGFDFGYGGSAPAQLALALLLDATSEAFALEHYEAFKADFIAPQREDAEGRVEQFMVTQREVRQWAGARLLPRDRKVGPCPGCATQLHAPLRCQNPDCAEAAVEAR